MTHEELRNLKKGDIVIRPCYRNIFVVKSIGWDDIDEKDYKYESDYIIEVTELFEHLETPHNGGVILVAHQSLPRYPLEYIKKHYKGVYGENKSNYLINKLYI